MTIRALIAGICMIAIVSSAGHAQTAASGPSNPAADAPPVDGARKTPDTPAPIPEVVAPPGQHGDVVAPKPTNDRAAVIIPPKVDPKMPVQRGASAADNQPVAPK